MATAENSITKRIEAMGQDSGMSDFQHRVSAMRHGHETWLDRLQTMVTEQPVRTALFGLGIGVLLGACCFGATRYRR